MTFSTIRWVLKSTLILCLTVMGHILLSTSSQPAFTSPALPTISALIFLTFLWLSFTLLELSDAPHRPLSSEEEDDDDDDEEKEWKETRKDPKVVFLSKTWVELLSGLIVLALWSLYYRETLTIVKLYQRAYILVPITYGLIFLCLALLNLQTMGSIAVYAIEHGPRSILDTEFWEARTGGWSGRIALKVTPTKAKAARDDVEAAISSSEKVGL
nr:uncharacterized protein CI109_000832 [Kwoniella shandongensis]KAA5530652.1 hypothetical protein CI109_000832 [Kwoniella shandongensis]